MDAPRLVALVGPTAAGKTALAVEVAAALPIAVEIVSLDSRQLYRRLDVGTGKPTAEERRRLPHHLVDVVDPEETFDAGRYRRAVAQLLPTLWGRGVTPLLVGGAGFYLRALQEGFHDVPADPARRAALRAEHATLPLTEIRRRLEQVDPAMAARLHPHDRYRQERALEIFVLAGEQPSVLASRFRPRPVHDCRFDILHLSPERRRLHGRIEDRARLWLGGAWQEEVRSLLDAGLPPGCPGLSILGYRDVVAHLQGRAGHDETLEHVIVATRRYARQQEIWFRKSPASWRGSSADEQAKAALAKMLADAQSPGRTA